MKPIRVGLLNFEPLLKSKLPVVLVFGSICDRGSRVLFSMMEEIGEKYDGIVIPGIVDIDYALELFCEYEVLETPTLMFFEGGKLTMRQSGYNGTFDIHKFLYKCFGVPPTY